MKLQLRTSIFIIHSLLKRKLMKRKATFAVKNAKTYSSAHNSRKSVPKYLIETDKSFDKNHYEIMNQYQNDKQFRELAKIIYKEKTKQKMQDKQIKALIKETVITAKEEHSSDDIKNLFYALHNKMGGGYYLLELAGHFDEGHFERTEDCWENLSYYPCQDILLKDDGKWYIKSDELKEDTSIDNFDLIANMSGFKKVMNIHWHAKFVHMNLDTGKTVRFTKSQVSGEGRLKFVAEFLGLRYAPEEKLKRGQAVGSVKERHHAERQEKYRQILVKKELTHKLYVEQDQIAEEFDMTLDLAKCKQDVLEKKYDFMIGSLQRLQIQNGSLNIELSKSKNENLKLQQNINRLKDLAYTGDIYKKSGNPYPYKARALQYKKHIDELMEKNNNLKQDNEQYRSENEALLKHINGIAAILSTEVHGINDLGQQKDNILQKQEQISHELSYTGFGLKI